MTYYTPVTQGELAILADLLGLDTPTWTGPALPRPQGMDGFKEILATIDRLLADGQYIIQMQDGFTTRYVIENIEATGERFMLGAETTVEQAAALRAILVLIESFFARLGFTDDAASPHPGVPVEARPHVDGVKARIEGWMAALMGRHGVKAASHSARDRPTIAATSAASGASTSAAAPSPSADYSGLALEQPEQFSMTWTTFEDVYRHGCARMRASPAEYTGIVESKRDATKFFWKGLSSQGLPYNLLVLRRLEKSTLGPYRTAFGDTVLDRFAGALDAGRLYGIDMTIFAGLAPAEVSNGTTRSTPSTMTLLVMDEAKALAPVAVHVADPLDADRSQIYTEDSDAWIYALMAVKTSLTVYGIWLGHVFTLHLVTAAVSMATWNELDADHVVFQALAPQSNFTIGFDLVLLIGWPRLAPPTSIGDFGKFLDLCSKFGDRHDFFSTDPKEVLTALNLDVADFTGADGVAWGLYPNVKNMLYVWDLTEVYAEAVVEAAYASDAAVANDAALQRWITAAGAPGGGNVVGLPKLADKPTLARVLTSLLYRVNVHGFGRLRSVSTPELAFAPNFPPCLQSAEIPAPDAPLGTAELLRTYLPRTGTLGGLVNFYGTFGFTAPIVPLVPYSGPGTEPFFSGFDKAGEANAALAILQTGIETLIAELQPTWVQTGQWPRNIEL